MTNKPKPFINIGPGQIISREMQALNWKQEDLAQILGLTPKTINLILNNKQGITIDTAILLAKAFKTSPEFWLKLDQNYRLRLNSETKEMKETEFKAEIRKHMPILEMKKKRWLDFDTKSTKSQIKAFCDFWGIKSIHFNMYSEELPFYTRRNDDDEIFTAYYSQTWFRKAKIEASKINVPDYNKAKLQKLINKAENFTLTKEGVTAFIQKLEECGVKFFVLSHIEKTYLDGASFMSQDNPAIVYTGRHKTIDSFWWTITHELAHVLLHLESKKNFLDVLDFSEQDNSTEENEADQFTAQVLKKNEIVNEHRKLRSRLSESSLKAIAEKLNISEAVVLGILQFSKRQTYRTKLNTYKYSALENIPECYFKG